MHSLEPVLRICHFLMSFDPLVETQVLLQAPLLKLKEPNAFKLLVETQTHTRGWF